MVDQLKSNRRCFYLNSPNMVTAMRAHLAGQGVNVAAEERRRALVLSSTQEFLIDGEFDSARMLAMLERAVQESLADGFGGLWASGDMGWELGSGRGVDQLLAYERSLEDYFRVQPALYGVCQYHVDRLPPDAIRRAFGTHRSLFIDDRLSRMNPFYALELYSLPALENGRVLEMLAWLRGNAHHGAPDRSLG